MEHFFEILGMSGIIVLGITLIVLGFVGSIMPAIPGPPIALVSIFLVHFGLDGGKYSWYTLSILILLTIVIALADYFVPILGTKKFGGTKHGVRGSTIGLILGVVITFFTSGFGFLLLLLGPFLGAFIGEKYAKNNNTIALRSAIGSLIGFLAGTLGKIIVVVLILIAFLYKVFAIIF